MLSYFAKLYYTFMLNVKNVRDYTCGYRAYKYSAVSKAKEKYRDKLVTQSSFACMMEVLYKISKIGAKFDEVPFVLRYDNKGGQSKMRVFKTIFNSLITALKLKLGII